MPRNSHRRVHQRRSSSARLLLTFLGSAIVMTVFLNVVGQRRLVKTLYTLYHQQEREVDIPDTWDPHRVHSGEKNLPNRTPKEVLKTRTPNDVSKPTVVPPKTKDERGDPVSRHKFSFEQIPSHHACDGFAGVYHVSKGDIGGAAGTIFFQFVIGQLVFAERNNLKPWIHLNNVSYIVYDPVVHGGNGTSVEFNAMKGVNVSYIRRPNGHWRDAVPGSLQYHNLQPTRIRLEGTGVWEHYFEPVSDFVPGDKSCEDKPLVSLDLFLITPGIHGFADWSPKCWRYEYLPDYITKPHIPLHEWLAPQRRMAHVVLKKYIRFQSHIQEMAYRANPAKPEDNCLGIHIRQSDKAAGRRQLTVPEFLPFCQAYVDAGGACIYLATDSSNVLKTIAEEWPKSIQSLIRTMGNATRSHDDTAVFDMKGVGHHQTNTEILVEILALSKCQFLVHGLSAVTETSIWINLDQHEQSVNLEDPDHLSPNEFGVLVQAVLHGAPQTAVAQLRNRNKRVDWWKPTLPLLPRQPTHQACEGVEGVLLIDSTGSGYDAAAGTAFFTSVLNQLIYAERYKLVPWIHLNHDDNLLIYDEAVHGSVLTESSIERFVTAPDANISTCPGNSAKPGKESTLIRGSGVWDSYFDAVSDVVPGDTSCKETPVVSIDSVYVSSMGSTGCPGSVRAWRYDDVPYDMWNPSNLTVSQLYGPMRKQASKIVKKYFKFKPYLLERAKQVNDPRENETCLAVHIRHSDKAGDFRDKIPPAKFRDYITAFVQAGGDSIFLATDSIRALEYIDGHWPERIRKRIRTQGRYVVRTAKKWPLHQLESHHRTNSEVLVDVLAMSRCQLLVHGYSAVSEAAVYLNPYLHEHSVNLEDPGRVSAAEFGELSRSVVNRSKNTTQQDDSNIDVAFQRNATGSETDRFIREKVNNVTIVRRAGRECKRNTIVYLAQKRHSTYDRDSYGILLRSLDMMNKNYLSVNNHHDNTDIFIFHTSDFDERDLTAIESRFHPKLRGIMRFADLTGSSYWKRPSWHTHDNPATGWYAFPLFSEGYRHMMRWFAVCIWEFFEAYNQQTGCGYRYLFRLDEDSFIRSPIQYDIFDFMGSHQYVYGFRLCAYEMQVTQRIWTLWTKSRKEFKPNRQIDLEMCGFYNNFFVADLSFFRSPGPKSFLRFVDRQGMIYRRRLGDLMIHSMTVYAFAQTESIHRFLDFTYEHKTLNRTTQCVVWGGIQAGYNDPYGESTVAKFFQESVVAKGCSANATFLSSSDLSPTYSHLPEGLEDNLSLYSVMAGAVELPGKGPLSG